MKYFIYIYIYIYIYLTVQITIVVFLNIYAVVMQLDLICFVIEQTFSRGIKAWSTESPRLLPVWVSLSFFLSLSLFHSSFSQRPSKRTTVI